MTSVEERQIWWLIARPPPPNEGIYYILRPAWLRGWDLAFGELFPWSSRSEVIASRCSHEEGLDRAGLGHSLRLK
jgi:hypothetical protein